MKARIKTTGEIVEVEDLYDDGTALVKDRYFKVSELDFFEDFEAIDWEQRRYEIAKSAMQGMLAHSTRYKPRNPNMNWHNAIAEEAKELSDALIKELKKG